MTARRTTPLLLALAALLLALAIGAGEALAVPPEILDVVIDRGRDADWWDWPTWHTRYVVQVQGSADEQPAQLWLEDMQGCRQVIQTDGTHWYDPAGTNPGGSWEDARVTAGPDDTYTYVWYEARQANPIPAGSYTITVIGTSGSQTSLTTADLPAVPAAVPALTAPAAEGVVSTTVPTFEWSGTSGSKTMLQVRAEGALNYTGPWPEVDDAGEIWRADVTGESSVVYNFDASGPDLDPGRTYFWEVSDWLAVDDRVTDPRVEVWNEQTARHRFTVDTTWPALPSLPGKLAYEHNMFGGWLPYNLEAILQYGTTPSERTWVGPDASHTPSYSWDGTKIAYRVSDWGIRVANADGSDSVRLFGNWAWSNADFSPDATSVTYSDGEWQGSSPQHVFIQKLFEPTRTLVVRARGQGASQPRWSPDGKWIAYASRDDPSGNEIWLVRPDGTDDHAVIPTSVAGYMDATITYMGGGPRWSPDAKQLGVEFGATPFEGPDISGIGVIPIEGGEITPIWLNPEGYVCCASAFFGTWSPDGESIVFSSAHHLPFDADWELGKFESGVELWLIDADGIGPPTRITYDYSHPWAPAWWAPNMPDGSDVSVTKGDATVTFADVAVGGSTSVCIVPEGPGPAPEGYELVGDCWTLLIDGAASGVTVELAYADAVVAPEMEPAVCLLAWIDEQWMDITTDLDTLHEIVTGYATALSHFTLALGQRFEDVDEEHWAFGPINACVSAGIVSGYEDGTYQPGNPVTRDQMAAYISRALAGGDENVPSCTSPPTFPDVEADHWAFDYVEYAFDQNVVGGYDDDLYHPEYEVTRDQMAVYVARAMVAPTGEAALADYVPADPRNFPDVATDFWCYRHVEYCVEHGVVSGYEDGLYHPEIVVTRDQMAVYVARAFGL